MAVKIKEKKRKDLKNSVTKEQRESRYVPDVIYRKEKESKAIQVNNLELIKTVRDEGINAIISLEIEGDKTAQVMLHEYQMHTLKDEIIHADFYVVDLTEEMDVEVPLRLDGEAQGSKDGGTLQQPFYVLQVRAIPSKIPEEITVDISALEIGDNLTVADLPVSEDYQFTDESDTTVAIVLATEAEEPQEDAEEADLSVEPEDIGADEDEEEED